MAFLRSLRPITVALIWFLFVLILLSVPGNDLPSTGNWLKVIYADKWIHAFLFGVMNWLFLRTLRGFPVQIRKSRSLLITALVIVWGFTTELLQGELINARSFELMDGVADASGALIAWLIFLKKQRSGT